MAVPSKAGQAEEAGVAVDWADVGSWIGEHRRRLGLSKNEASRRARVSNTTWRQLEAGQNATPTDETLVRVARALDLEPGELLARCSRRSVDSAFAREVPTASRTALTEVLEGDRRLDPRSRRMLIDLYELLASR